jgi:hypothetical protein
MNVVIKRTSSIDIKHWRFIGCEAFVVERNARKLGDKRLSAVVDIQK